MLFRLGISTPKGHNMFIAYLDRLRMYGKIFSLDIEISNLSNMIDSAINSQEAPKMILRMYLDLINFSRQGIIYIKD
jgi:hypothetical protein